MAQVLLFNISGEKKRKICALLASLGIAYREVAPLEHGLPLSALMGRVEAVCACDGTVPFSDEMLIMDELSPLQFDALLTGLRQTQAPVALKAVVTEQNLRWSAAKLHSELAAEHEAMRRLAGNSGRGG